MGTVAVNVTITIKTQVRVSHHEDMREFLDRLLTANRMSQITSRMGLRNISELTRRKELNGAQYNIVNVKLDEVPDSFQGEDE